VTADYAYNAMRSVLLAVLQHNATRPHARISKLFCPDVFIIRRESPMSDELTDRHLEDTVRQLCMATRSVLVDPAKVSSL